MEERLSRVVAENQRDFTREEMITRACRLSKRIAASSCMNYMQRDVDSLSVGADGAQQPQR